MKTKSEEIAALKLKIEQKKNRIAQEEIKFKIKERKQHTRHLIEIGGLVVKAGLDALESNALLGALLHLQDLMTEDHHIKAKWTKRGKEAFGREEQARTPIILQFEEKPTENIRAHIRNCGLKWNSLRNEWYGYVTNMPAFKAGLQDIKCSIDIINSDYK